MSILSNVVKGITSVAKSTFSTVKTAGSIAASFLPGGTTPAQAISRAISSNPIVQAASSGVNKIIASVSPQKAAAVSKVAPILSGPASYPNSSSYIPPPKTTSSAASTPSPSTLSTGAAVAAATGAGALLASALNKKEEQGTASSPGETKMADNTGSEIMVAGRSLSSIGGMVNSGVLTKLGTAGLIAGGLYAGEQLLEKMGVRGGAGLIGARPMKRHRRMNIANVKALKRADRRIDGFIKTYRKVASSVGYTLQRRETKCSSKRK